MRPSLLVLAVAAAVLAACGGSKHPPLAHAGFVRSADAICARADRDVRALGTPAGLPALASFADRAVAIDEGALDQLRALTPPAADRNEVLDLLVVLDRALGATRAVGAAAQRGDRTTAERELVEAKRAAAEADGLARSLGAPSCGA